MQKCYRLFAASIVSLACMSATFAAQPVDLSHRSAAFLNSFTSSGSSLKQISSAVDFNQTQHIRMQQQYLGYPVWGGDVVAHVANNPGLSLKGLLSNQQHATTLNGTLYQDMDKELSATLNLAANPEQKNKALQQAIGEYQKKSGNIQPVKDIKNELMVYVDENNKAHWAYFIRFSSKSVKGMPEKTHLSDGCNDI